MGITEVVAGRCGRCNIQLRPQFFQDLKKGETAEKALREAGFGSARLISPVAPDSPVHEDWPAGAKLVRVIDARN